MPLQFSRLCDLFSDLESLTKRQPPLFAAALRQESKKRVHQWCNSLSLSITSTDIDLVALLSALLPKRRTDRVYGIQPRSLSRKLKRILGLGNGRHQLLDRWQEAGWGDLGDCVERALKQAEFPLQPRIRQVTLEEIDTVLASIAARYRFSAPKVRAAAEGATDQQVDDALQSLYRRMQSTEAKWLTRMILKEYGSVDIPESVAFRCIDFQMPAAMKIHDSFEDAIRLLGSDTSRGSADGLMPRVGVKVGRTTYAKARSVKHAVSMIENRRMSVERKYDGEYCQIHVDITRPNDQIQIFSKSGKDSTADRNGLHDTLRQCLGLGSLNCAFSSKCILEGEMVIWSDREEEILEFHKIRKHVSRSGSFLGTSADSLPHHHEHLMMVFYDVLLVDDNSCLPLPHRSRRRILHHLISQVPGRAELAAQYELNFSSHNGPESLRDHYAHAIASRWEGLVLKPSDEPYFGSDKRRPGDPPTCWLKLKKDYIAGLGDTADFAVVGAGYCVKAASKCGIANLNWTHFHIGCLKNKDAVIHLGATPEYVVLDAVNQSLNAKDLRHLNQHGQFHSLEVGSTDCAKAFKLEYAAWEGPKMTVAFRKPFVFEVMGGGFVKLANSQYYALRWPRVLKIHQDRNWKESVSLDELQHLAIEASTVPDEDNFETEVESWRRRLDNADRGVRKVMLPWDDSQSEQSDLDHSVMNPSRRTPRSNGITAPPLIRMDTSEMAPDEQRLGNGEVSRRPTSSGSIISMVSGSSLPTPPTSSPNVHHGAVPPGPRTRFPLVASPSTRKRPIGDLEDRTAPPKKPKFVEQKSAARPLRESPSSANRARRPSHPSAKVRPDRHPNSFLVRKVPPGVDGLPIKSRFKAPRHIIESESPDRQTTASGRTSQTTSCPSQNSARAASLEPGPVIVRRDVNLLGNPAPSPALAIVNNLPRTQIPDLLTCPVMLSPCISRTPYLLENLLPGRVNDIVPLPQLSIHASLPTPPPTNPTSGQGAVLLIESRRHDQSSRLMISMLPFLRQSSYARIEVWDWTLLELISKGETDTRRMGTRFFGSMWWDAEANEAKLHWKDGLLMRLRIEAGGEVQLIEKARWDAHTE